MTAQGNGEAAMKKCSGNGVAVTERLGQATNRSEARAAAEPSVYFQSRPRDWSGREPLGLSTITNRGELQGARGGPLGLRVRR
jgi:hypothetical protein